MPAQTVRRLRDGLMATIVREPLDELPTNTTALEEFDWNGFFLSLAKKALNARLHKPASTHSHHHTRLETCCCCCLWRTVISLCIALLLLIVGWIFVKLIMCVVRRALQARKSMDPTLQRWLISVLGATLKIFLFIVFIDALGIETLSIAGMIAAIGVAIGTALSGVVQNFAAGVIIVGFALFFDTTSHHITSFHAQQQTNKQVETD